MTDRFEKLALYQAKESILISQYIQRVEVFSGSVTRCLYQQYRAGQSFHFTSLNVTIEIRQLYRRLSIPMLIEEAEEHTDNDSDGYWQTSKITSQFPPSSEFILEIPVDS